MRILLGLQFAGATLTEVDDLGAGRGTIGSAVWSPAELLRDLELRLGMGFDTAPGALRVATWAERMARLAPRDRFYSRSFEVDPLGTARAVLELRDLLIGSEWNGQSIPDGGPRLDAIRELETLEGAALPLGPTDRVTAVARALERCAARFYGVLELAEPRELWPMRWQAVFRTLERAGTRLTANVVSLPGAAPETDLGRVQTALRLGPLPRADVFRGDGSFVRLTAETSWEAARATAAVLAGLPAERTVVIRENEVSALDNALAVHGLRPQGWRSRSPWRAALQVLPLALELTFEPKDPYRVLELLTLPVGPFQGRSGHHLARALAESPGIGSPAWEDAKTELAKLADSSELIGRIGEWLESLGAESSTGAPKVDLLAVIARVRAWIVSRVATAPEDPTLLAAAGHATALRAALESDPRSRLGLVEVRRLAESILASGTNVELEEERAGRIDHVACPGGLRVPREVVLWWSFVDSGSARSTLPWRKKELLALSNAGIRFPDPRALLAERANDWRRAIFAATGRVILVTPRTSAGASLAPHPLWDEIVARTCSDEAAPARVELSVPELLAASPRSLLEVPPLSSLESVSLPGGHSEWMVPEGDAPRIQHLSASSLSELLGCPLQWALHHGAGVRGGGHALPPLFRLNGTLGHRLVELLHQRGAFNRSDEELERSAQNQLDELFQREGAVFLRAGMGFERGQLRSQLVHAVLALSRALRAAGLRILAVEKPIDVSWRSARLKGSIDILVATEAGVRAIIDTKWGLTTYRKILESGRALQLAVYAFAHATEAGEQRLPDAAYFSLSRGQLVGLSSRVWANAEALDGPSLDETWRKIERSMPLVERIVRQGKFPVAGVRRSLPLLSALGIAENEQKDYLALEAEAACEYCTFDALCGKRWEAAE